MKTHILLIILILLFSTNGYSQVQTLDPPSLKPKLTVYKGNFTFQGGFHSNLIRRYGDTLIFLQSSRKKSGKKTGTINDIFLYHEIYKYSFIYFDILRNKLSKPLPIQFEGSNPFDVIPIYQKNQTSLLYSILTPDSSIRLYRSTYSITGIHLSSELIATRPNLNTQNTNNSSIAPELKIDGRFKIKFNNELNQLLIYYKYLYTNQFVFQLKDFSSNRLLDSCTVSLDSNFSPFFANEVEILPNNQILLTLYHTDSSSAMLKTKFFRLNLHDGLLKELKISHPPNSIMMGWSIKIQNNTKISISGVFYGINDKKVSNSRILFYSEFKVDSEEPYRSVQTEVIENPLEILYYYDDMFLQENGAVSLLMTGKKLQEEGLPVGMRYYLYRLEKKDSTFRRIDLTPTHNIDQTPFNVQEIIKIGLCIQNHIIILANENHDKQHIDSYSLMCIIVDGNGKIVSRTPLLPTKETPNTGLPYFIQPVMGSSAKQTFFLGSYFDPTKRNSRSSLSLFLEFDLLENR